MWKLRIRPVRVTAERLAGFWWTLDRSSPVPAGGLEALGIARYRLMHFRQATGQIVERWVGFAIIHVSGIATSDDVVFAEASDLLLLGSRTLEGLNVRIDPVRSSSWTQGRRPPPRAAGSRAP